MARKATSKRFECRIPAYQREDVLSIQDAKQKAGWEITAFNLPDAWKISQGEGVKIAVIDTGCQLNHPDLEANLLPGKNFVQRNKAPWDDAEHGTHCTGIICAVNNDIGMVGVAPKAKVVPVKALNSQGTGNLLDVADAIQWSADQGVDFITMSLGSPNPLPQVEKAVKYAVSKGVVIFCAAGNAGQTREIFYPAAMKETLGIGAVDQNFKRANFSCTGPDLDFLAPGVKIFSTIPKNWYAVLSGTSMACPFVVGVAALLLSAKKAGKKHVRLETAEDYKTIFKQNVMHVKDKAWAGKKFFEGYGIIDPQTFEEWARSS